jgi:molecular chaperone GrpE (heat shock protein)
MSQRTERRLPKLPFFFADAVLLGAAWLIYRESPAPMPLGQMLLCSACVALGAILSVAPFLVEYRAALALGEADRLTSAVLQIENIEIIGRQIKQATANWQTADEHAAKSVEAAREIAERITAEAQSFTEFLKKANDTEKHLLRLEVEKLRRAESEWLQILVRILDHIFALYQAAVRSGQANLVAQLGQFQNSCRDIARRVGVVPFVASPGEPYDAKLHQLADSKVVPAAEARVAETIATGYSFQGQVVRSALVRLHTPEPAGEPMETTDTSGEKIVALEKQPHAAETATGFGADPVAEIPQPLPETAEPGSS